MYIFVNCYHIAVWIRKYILGMRGEITQQKESTFPQQFYFRTSLFFYTPWYIYFLSLPFDGPLCVQAVGKFPMVDEVIHPPPSPPPLLPPLSCPGRAAGSWAVGHWCGPALPLCLGDWGWIERHSIMDQVIWGLIYNWWKNVTLNICVHNFLIGRAT